MMRPLPAVVLSFALFAAGCTGARANVRFDEATQPISLSPTVLDREAQVLLPEHQEKRGELEVETRVWSIFYTAIPLTPNRELAPALNAEVARHRGEAVVNLKLDFEPCDMNWVPLFILPIYPSCVVVTAHGDIIRDKRGSSASAP